MKLVLGLVFFLQSATALVQTGLATVKLKSVVEEQDTVLDGGEWQSVQAVLEEEGRLDKEKSTKMGRMTVVSGLTSNGDRVVGMLSPEGDVYEDSLAMIPKKISDQDAIATFISAFPVHAAIPKAESVGGSSDSLIGGKVVVLGGSEYACFAAEGLASLDVSVFLVSSKPPKISSPAGKSLEVLTPGVGPSKIAFSSHIGQFDSVLDTVCNERPINIFRRKWEGPGNRMMTGSSVLTLMASMHGCQKYVSTLTECQEIISTEGILGGPRKADEHAATVTKSFRTNPDCQPIPPPVGIGFSLETMMEQGVIFPQQKRKKLQQKSPIVRGWTLADFWEQSTWPRDSSGTGTVRFGLPVIDEPDPDLEPMILEAPYRAAEGKTYIPSEPDIEFDGLVPPKPIQDNPFVYQIAGVHGVETEIMEEKLDSILFLSAKFCKTCKSLNQQYTRMARLATEEDSSTLVFTKAEASGKFGKQLGRYFEVDAVPAFIFFRKGEKFGVPLSVSRLPSSKIDKAIELLLSDSDWDPSVLDLS